jgi:hypothetical protein
MVSRGELRPLPSNYEDGIRDLYDAANEALITYSAYMAIGWSDRRLALAAAHSDGSDRYYIYPPGQTINSVQPPRPAIVMAHRDGQLEDETWFQVSNGLVVAHTTDRTETAEGYPVKRRPVSLSISELVALNEKIRLSVPLDEVLEERAKNRPKASLNRHLGALIRYAIMIPDHRPDSYKDLIR